MNICYLLCLEALGVKTRFF